MTKKSAIQLLLVFMVALASMTAIPAFSLNAESFFRTSSTDPITPPYESDFGNEDENSRYIMVNRAEHEWYLSEKWAFLFGHVNLDDWLITPSLYLEEGKNYAIEAIGACREGAGYSFPVLDISAGIVTDEEGDVPSQLTDSIVSDFIFTKGQDKDNNMIEEIIQGSFVPVKSGNYRIGFHFKSDGPGRAYLIRWKISAGVSSSSPAAPEDYSIAADIDGSLCATIRAKAPSKNMEGMPLESLTEFVVRNHTTGEIVGRIQNPVPGDEYEMFDTNADAGYNEYCLWFSNEAGDGEQAWAKAYIGFDSPGAPAAVTCRQEGSDVVVNWMAPETGRHGGPVDRNNIVYDVCRWPISSPQDFVVAENVDGLEFTDRTMEGISSQICMQYVVKAKDKNADGEEGVESFSNFILFVQPYDLIFSESFIMAKTSTTPWTIGSFTQGDATWNIVESDGNIAAEDLGMLKFTPNTSGAPIFISPIISLQKSIHPVLTFNSISTDGQMDILISTDAANTWVSLESIGASPSSETWKENIIDLSEFAGKNVCIGFKGDSSKSSNTALIDDIIVRENIRSDLGIMDFNAPAYVKAGETVRISVTVCNYGMDVSLPYTLSVSNGNHEVFEENGKSLSIVSSGINMGFYKNTHVFDIMTPKTEDSLVLTAIVTMADDSSAENDIMTISIPVIHPQYPEPLNLTANRLNDNRSQLVWSEPDLSAEAMTVTDDLESYTSWETGGIDVASGITYGWIGEYKVIDGDQLPTTKLLLLSDYVQSIPSFGAPMSCTVFDMGWPYSFVGNYGYMAHSGQKVFGFMGSSSESDNWLILPRLGLDKTVSFYARAYSDYGGAENFDIMISNGGSACEDFKVYHTEENVSKEYNALWSDDHGFSKFEFTLPEDTEYAAIRERSSDGYLLMIDDITYTPAYADPRSLNLMGYNVYCDGTKVNVEPLKDCLYNIPLEYDLADHLWNVTAVYSDAESKFSNSVSSMSAVQTPVLSNVTIMAANGMINIGNYTGKVNLFSVDGVRIVNAYCDNSLVISVDTGVYIVDLGTYKAKVIVK